MAAIEFDDLDVEQGFNFKPDVQKNFGHISSLQIGTSPLPGSAKGIDFSLRNPVTGSSPTSKPIGQVAVLKSLTWGAGLGDKMALKFHVSTANKQAINKFLHEDLSNVSVQISWIVWEYDPNAKTYYKAFFSLANPTWAIVNKEGGKDLILKVAKTPFEGVKSPMNWEIEMEILPQTGSAQDIGFQVANGSIVAKSWGIAVAGTSMS